MYRLAAVCLLLDLFTFRAFPEEHTRETAPPIAECASGRCGNGSSAWIPKGISTMSSLFPNLGDKFAKAAFEGPLKMMEGETQKDVAKIPDGIEKAVKDKDESDISAMMAIFFGTIREAQRDRIVREVEGLRQAEKSKTTEDRRDEKYLALLDRLFWAGKALQGTLLKEPEAQDFLKKFVGTALDFKSGDFNKIQAQNDLINKKMKEAREGSTEAKKFLRDTLNRDAFLAYLDDELKNGKPGNAAKLADAVSWKDEGSGQKFLDLTLPGGDKGRLFIGSTNDEIKNSLSLFSNEFPRFGGHSLAQAPFDTVNRAWHVNGGKLTPGNPPGGRLPIEDRRIADSRRDEPPRAEPTRTPAPPGSTPTTPPPRDPAERRFDLAQLKQFLTRCDSCHAGLSDSARGTSGANVTFTGTMITGTGSLSRAITAAGTVTSMARFRAELQAWLAAR